LFVILLTRELIRLGYDASLATGKCDHVDLDMSYLLNEGDPVDWIPEMSRSVSFRNDILAVWRLYRLMRAEKPVIVQTHTAKAGGLGRIAARLAGVPIIVHTFHGHVMSGYFPRHVSFAIRLIERFLAAFSDVICVLAPQQKKDLVDRFHIASGSKFRVMPLGLDLAPFQRLAPVPERPDGFLTVGWLGRFVQVKNLALLIDVMEKTFDRNRRIRFVVAGDGTERRLIEQAAARWGPERLEWCGWTTDVTDVIRRCDILIQTSRNEGTPVALIQGMAAGRPFVSTPAGGVVDMVDGSCLDESFGAQWFSNAVLVKPDAVTFASVLDRFQSEPALTSSMGQAAAAFASTRYGIEELASNYAEFYGELLATRRAQ
jgi:glycosyltransferase involved in cell wall biosynthesis